MKIGLQVPNFTWPGGPKEIYSKLAEIARTADQAGFSSLWVMDHFFQIGRPNNPGGLGPAEDEMLEGYNTLSYLAEGQMSVSDVIEQCRILADMGVQHAIFNMPNIHEITPLEIFGREIIPVVTEL